MKFSSISENQFRTLFYMKLGCLLFFTTWFLLACLTNIFDFINGLYGLADWHFRSDNYSALAKVLLIYHSPTWFLNTLFTFDILAQGISSVLFAISFISFLRFKTITPIINMAFGISMALWAIFIVMEEIFIAYLFEGTHLQLLSFELLSLLFLYFLPHDNSKTLQ